VVLVVNHNGGIDKGSNLRAPCSVGFDSWVDPKPWGGETGELGLFEEK